MIEKQRGRRRAHINELKSISAIQIRCMAGHWTQYAGLFHASSDERVPQHPKNESIIQMHDKKQERIEIDLKRIQGRSLSMRNSQSNETRKQICLYISVCSTTADRCVVVRKSPKIRIWKCYCLRKASEIESNISEQSETDRHSNAHWKEYSH